MRGRHTDSVDLLLRCCVAEENGGHGDHGTGASDNPKSLLRYPPAIRCRHLSTFGLSQVGQSFSFTFQIHQWNQLLR